MFSVTWALWVADLKLINYRSLFWRLNKWQRTRYFRRTKQKDFLSFTFDVKLHMQALGFPRSRRYAVYADCRILHWPRGVSQKTARFFHSFLKIKTVHIYFLALFNSNYLFWIDFHLRVTGKLLSLESSLSRKVVLHNCHTGSWWILLGNFSWKSEENIFIQAFLYRQYFRLTNLNEGTL